MPRTHFSNEWWQAVSSAYRKLVQRAAASDESVSASMLLQSMRRPMKCVFAKIGNTCKTHKPPGRVALRYLHLAGTYPFESLARWFSRSLDRRLRTFNHFLVDSRSFMADVSALLLPADAQILHFDLDDFFNSGTPSFLAHASSSILYPVHQQLAKDICSFLLQHQYVYSEVDANNVWNVLLGSGQGLTASAAIANAGFMFSAELNGASWCRSTTRQQYNIIFYRRYVDNLFFIVANPESASNLLAYIHRSLDVYTGKVEDLCKESFGFLDCTYTFHRYENYSKLIPAPLLKLSSQFLSTQSAHPWQLHVAWPLAFLKTIHMRSDTIADY